MLESSRSSGARTTATDPLRTVWDALEAAGCGPHGKPYDIRARCAAHDGGNPDSLSVSVGSDGRCLVYCHAHACSVEDIAAAIGLTVADLFPAGHRHARRLDVPRASRPDFTDGPARDVANILYAVDQLDGEWRCELILRCPACGDPMALLVASTRHPTFMSCPNACTATQAAQVLAGQLADRRAA
jgi:hypothetical protein